ncbi:amphi-Trp domain-containing protein [Nocardia seriolae]|nr:amphi-Trp domain-containing protein [Nocardia seriolae]APA99096.1 hypothetical protein NS506_05050 [Nocardia seriolae]MTJ63498.1 hypothetical protein [Nocardia seriolae]MTJ76239.1 hypothetical protein [Nocardia seriolae]MTJ88703.1 hypothetical protein [Nocardia seriolae]MTK32682.1 hypothetical protein [Nocardia seriolae]
MTHHKIYKDRATFDRSRLADELRRIADELDAGGVVTYGTDGNAGFIALPEEVDGKLEIERSKNEDEIRLSAELRFPAGTTEN